ncbi:N-acetylglucosamine-6-phosphate deacetylase [Cohnella pontilimi]|uniref:N-acetylglucosamine-6-phosphate deacetylase n=1 Tax=Cohnella pontilimi TaxID=2564100 RepID=A0A4U0FKP1_9BACL|nr:N-acetylglucosamine-6-phosphate deacetylase [Cohnella pontilimi]TJY44132.1 N-acetylglucosamine-6-phosphate deacetylase [Cohnella pontilimi]
MNSSITGIHYETGDFIQLHIQDGRIARIESRPLQPDDDKVGLGIVAPGLFDFQINGYMGMDLNDPPLSTESVVRLTRALWKEGVTRYLPTVITQSREVIENSVRVIAEACLSDEMVSRCAAGIHLEGPFISPEDGPRGAHNKAYVTAPDWGLFQRWQEAARGKIRLITLSPEWPEAADFISSCVRSGVQVSIGHTNATTAQLREAVDAGARMSTHLGNGSHPMLPRHPNYIWDQLAEDELWAGFIADGFHLPDSVLKVILKVKGARAILVSDAVALSGMEPGEYETPIGGKVVFTPEGRLHVAEHPKLLAGSAQMLPWGINHLVNAGLCSLSEAWNLASITPARFLGVADPTGLTEGANADVVIMKQDSDNLCIKETYKDGKLVYQA